MKYCRLCYLVTLDSDFSYCCQMGCELGDVFHCSNNLTFWFSIYKRKLSLIANKFEANLVNNLSPSVWRNFCVDEAITLWLPEVMFVHILEILLWLNYLVTKSKDRANGGGVVRRVVGSLVGSPPWWTDQPFDAKAGAGASSASTAEESETHFAGNIRETIYWPPVEKHSSSEEKAFDVVDTW